MNYEDMTDFEINKAVAKSQGLFAIAVAQDGLIVQGKSLSVNYCENPADAWPIILENKINLLWDTESTEWEAQAIVTTEMYFPSTCEHFYYDENPLRSAMVVYLMMNEDKK